MRLGTKKRTPASPSVVGHARRSTLGALVRPSRLGDADVVRLAHEERLLRGKVARPSTYEALLDLDFDHMGGGDEFTNRARSLLHGLDREEGRWEPL